MKRFSTVSPASSVARSRTAQFALMALVASSAMVATGCRGQTSKDTPIFGIRNMYDQPRYDVQEESPYFEDKRAMRPIPEGTMPRERNPDLTVTSGRTEDNMGYLMTVPKAVLWQKIRALRRVLPKEGKAKLASFNT